MIPLRDFNPTQRVTYVTFAIMVACIAVFFLVQPEATTGDNVRFSFEYAAIPCELREGRPLLDAEVSATLEGDETACTDVAASVGTEFFDGKNVWFAVLISMFLHGSVMHLGGNMLFFWIFGNNIEDRLGHIWFTAFYVAGGVFATAAHVLIQTDSTVPLIGASGAIAATMGAYLVWFPKVEVRTLLFLGIPLWPRLPAYVPLLLWFGGQFVIDPNGGVAWMAHVGGFVFGIVVALVIRASGALGSPGHVDMPTLRSAAS